MSVLANFHYQVTGPEGDSPKLVFLHGVMGYLSNWRRIAKAFEDRYQVLAYDQRGHGRSFQPAIGYGPEEYAEDLRSILQELGWSKISLVGHSMGGRVAYHFANEYPESVTRLVIEDIGPAIFKRGADLIMRILDVVPVPFPNKRMAKEWFENDFLKSFAAEPRKEGLAAYLYANITENEKKEAVWRFFEPGIRESIERGRQEDRSEDLEQLKIPTLLVRGELSTDLPRDVFERILRENPNIEGVEIPGAAHWVHSDQPDLFIKEVASFFSRHHGL